MSVILHQPIEATSRMSSHSLEIWATFHRGALLWLERDLNLWGILDPYTEKPRARHGKWNRVSFKNKCTKKDSQEISIHFFFQEDFVNISTTTTLSCSLAMLHEAVYFSSLPWCTVGSRRWRMMSFPLGLRRRRTDFLGEQARGTRSVMQ